MTAPADHAQAGFTLPEALVTLAVTGLLLGFAFTGLHQSSRLWDRIDRRGSQMAVTAAVQERLRPLIQQAQPVPKPDSQALAFEGEAGSLRMVTTLPVRTPATVGPVELTVRSGVGLVMRWADGEAVLLPDAAAVTFSYLGATGWKAIWHDQTELPRLVEVKVSFHDNRGWPSLLVAPLIDAAVGCSFDRLIGTCVAGS